MDFIGHYLDLGWAVIPLRPRSKAPVLPWKEFQEKPPGAKEWATWRVLFPVPPHGLGVICGAVSDLIVIDCDDKETASRLLAEIPFETPASQTQRGFHFFFRYRPGIPSMAIEVPEVGKLEIKADRSLITLPPSTHPEGHRYEWVLAPWDVDTLPELPDWLVELLRKQERQKELARQVARVSFPRPGRRLTPETLREILAQTKAEIVGEIPLGDREAWRLKACPVCGESEGSPWIWVDTGRLVDFRASCPASRDHGGLSLQAWLKELGREDLIENLEVEESEEASSPEIPVITVEEARRLILEALRDNRDVFLSVPPGTGKSTLALEWACREAPQPVVFSTPTLELARELAERARKGTNEPVITLSGRNPDTCPAWPETEKARKLGYDPGQVVCPRCQYNPDIPTLSPKCLFYKQFENLKRERGIYFGSHILIAHLLKNELKKSKIWILDESPLSLIHEVEISVEALRTLRAIFPPESETMRLAEKILALGDELHRVVSQTGKGSGRIYPRSPKYGPWAGRKSLVEWLSLDFTALAPKVREEIEQIHKTFGPRKLFNLGVNLHALRWIEEAVGRGACYLAALRDPKRPVILHRTEILAPRNWLGRIVTLDATGFTPIIRQLLDRPELEEINLQIPVVAQTVWVKAAVSKVAINKKKGHKRALNVAEKVIKEFDGDRTLIFVHKDLKKQVSEIIQQGALAHHFGTEARGVNRFEDFNTVILLGLPVPNPGTYYDTAVALGLDNQEFEVWLDLIAKAEAWQEANRIRPVLSPGKTIVVVAPRWPFDLWLGAPKEIRDLTVTGGKIARAVKVLLLWLDVFGFLTLEVVLLLGIGKEGQIPPEEAQSEVWARIKRNFPEKSSKFEEALFSLIDPDTPFEPEKGKQRNSKEKRLKGVSRSLNNSLIDLPHALEENSQVFPEPPNISARACHRSLRLPRVEFKDSSWWRQIFRRLRKARPDLPLFEIKLQTRGGPQWTRGLGDMRAAQDFYRALGREIDPNSWREVGNV